jgi:hypothetical protein
LVESDDVGSTLQRAASALGALQQLTLAKCRGVTCDGFGALADACPRLSSLTLEGGEELSAEKGEEASEEGDGQQQHVLARGTLRFVRTLAFGTPPRHAPLLRFACDVPMPDECVRALARCAPLLEELTLGAVMSSAAIMEPARHCAALRTLRLRALLRPKAAIEAEGRRARPPCAWSVAAFKALGAGCPQLKQLVLQGGTAASGVARKLGPLVGSEDDAKALLPMTVAVSVTLCAEGIGDALPNGGSASWLPTLTAVGTRTAGGV